MAKVRMPKAKDHMDVVEDHVTEDHMMVVANNHNGFLAMALWFLTTVSWSWALLGIWYPPISSYLLMKMPNDHEIARNMKTSAT